MRRILLILDIVFIFAQLNAAFEDKKPGARNAALAGAGLMLVDDCTAVYYNPAGLSFLTHPQALFTHTNLFSLSDLRYDWTGCAFPVGKRWGVGTAVSQFGPPMYREQEIILGCGYKIIPQASFGISLTYMRLAIEDYGSTHEWAGSFGFISAITPCIRLGMHGRNIYSTHIGETDAMPEKGVSAGVSYLPKDYLTSVAEISREIDNTDWTYRLGQEIMLFKFFIMRFGVHNNPDRVSGGLGFLWQGIRIDYGIITHAYLGFEHHVSMSIWW